MTRILEQKCAVAAADANTVEAVAAVEAVEAALLPTLAALPAGDCIAC